MDFNDLTIDELREQASRLRLCLPYSDIEACRERAEELLEDEGTESSSCCYEQKEITK